MPTAAVHRHGAPGFFDLSLTLGPWDSGPGPSAPPGDRQSCRAGGEFFPLQATTLAVTCHKNRYCSTWVSGTPRSGSFHGFRPARARLANSRVHHLELIIGAAAMSSASRRCRRTGPRNRSMTCLHVEALEARLAAGTVVDLFGSNWAGLGVFGTPGGILPSKVVTADSPRTNGIQLHIKHVPRSLRYWRLRPRRSGPRSTRVRVPWLPRPLPRKAPSSSTRVRAASRAPRTRRGTGWEPLTPLGPSPPRRDRSVPAGVSRRVERPETGAGEPRLPVQVAPLRVEVVPRQGQ